MANGLVQPPWPANPFEIVCGASAGMSILTARPALVAHAAATTMVPMCVFPSPRRICIRPDAGLGPTGCEWGISRVRCRRGRLSRGRRVRRKRSCCFARQMEDARGRAEDRRRVAERFEAGQSYVWRTPVTLRKGEDDSIVSAGYLPRHVRNAEPNSRIGDFLALGVGSRRSAIGQGLERMLPRRTVTRQLWPARMPEWSLATAIRYQLGDCERRQRRGRRADVC